MPVIRISHILSRCSLSLLAHYEIMSDDEIGNTQKPTNNKLLVSTPHTL